MKSLISGAVASMGLTAALLVAPATAAPIPTVAGTLASQAGDAIAPVAMMSMRQKMMMRNKMMMRQKMMMRNKMMMRKRMMMKKPMMKAM